MKDVHQQLLDNLELYLKTYPEIRFGQALFNLNINEFFNPVNPGADDHHLRDIYNDTDEAILKRMTNA